MITAFDILEERRRLALRELQSIVDDYEAETDQRVVMAISILEGDLNALHVARKQEGAK